VSGCSRFKVLASPFAFSFGSRFLVVPASMFVAVALDAAVQTSDADLLARVGDYVERYYARAQTIVATETVTVQPVSRSLEAEGPPRRLINDVRIEWAAQGAQPRAVRELISADGPRLGPRGQPDCLDPRSFTLEPLAFLLPSNRETVRLSIGRIDTIGGSRAQRIDYQPRAVESPRVRWDGKCGWIDTFGRTRGSVWVNPVTGAVLRFEERLRGRVNLPGPEGDANAPEFVAERADTTIDYEIVAFSDPDELLLLPSRVESVTFIRNSGVPRVRVTRTFTDYRRFLTAGRVLP
jgi:hypothetical protein